MDDVLKIVIFIVAPGLSPPSFFCPTQVRQTEAEARRSKSEARVI